LVKAVHIVYERTVKAMPKLKIPQYKVRGKHQDYYVEAFPNHSYMWPYYEKFDREYIIDADAAGWEQLRYAIAILLQAHDRIIYFPTARNNIENPITEFYENYDTVLTVAVLHFKRSEWIRLRRQLKPEPGAEFCFKLSARVHCRQSGTTER